MTTPAQYVKVIPPRIKRLRERKEKGFCLEQLLLSREEEAEEEGDSDAVTNS